MTSSTRPSLYIGLMSGTSLDGIDAVLVDFTPSLQILDCLEIKIPHTIKEEIRALNSPCDNELVRSLILDRQLAYLFAEACHQLLQQAGTQSQVITAIGSHGQTLRHAPDGPDGYSLQIGDGNTLAEETGICVVNNFRGRDIAAGGQGAPLVPAFHQAVFGDREENRAIVNIGGMANVSFLNSDGSLSGFDTGPGNVLMDSWCQQHLKQEFDHNGSWAKSGKYIPKLLRHMLAEPFFQQPPPKSTGRELFDRHWLKPLLQDCNYAAADIQATLLELTAHSISNAVKQHCDAVYLCGGGAYNLYLTQRIAELSGKPTTTTEQLGIKPEWIEAAAFAWLAKQTLEGLSGNAPSATGSNGQRILGAVYSK